MTDWIEWRGGKCPVPPDTKVEVRLRDGREILSFWARGVYWPWMENPELSFSDIVAYRVVSEPSKPSPPWIEFPKWYCHDGGPAPCPPEIWVEVPGQYAQVRREHAATIQWYGIQYWRPADDRYEFKFDEDRLVAYRLKETT